MPQEQGDDMRNVTLQVHAEVGLHARPAAIFVQQAGQFDSIIQIRNLTTSSNWVDAKSILSVLTLGVEKIPRSSWKPKVRTRKRRLRH